LMTQLDEVTSILSRKILRGTPPSTKAKGTPI